jgi:uncharacterized DUF497 family protein
MEFSWDPKKAARNLTKHGISFHEAATVFDDPLAYSFPDPDHSMGEGRLLTFGLSRQGRLLVVAYSYRTGALRVISARRATRKERRIYEESES